MKYYATQAHDITSKNAYIKTIGDINESIQKAMNSNFYDCSVKIIGSSAYDVARVLNDLVRAGYDVAVSKDIRTQCTLLIKWDNPNPDKGTVIFQDVNENYKIEQEKLKKELRNFDC